MATPRIDGPRACTQAELPEVIALVDEALRRHGTGQTLLTDYPLVYQDQNLPNVRILKVDGELAAVVPVWPRPVRVEECRFSIGIISPTATAVAHRRQGYGTRCLASCLESMERLGCELSVLWTRVPTFPFYEHSGYQAVRAQERIFQCRQADAARFIDDGEEAVLHDPARPRYLEAIRTMHERDGGGIFRAGEEYPALFSLPRMQTRVALRDGAPVAYLVVSAAVNKPGLVEAGGDPAAVETLVHRALSPLDGESAVVAHAHWSPTLLGDLIEQRLSDREPAPSGPMMVRLNRPRAFFEQIAPWLERGHRRAQRGGDAGANREFSLEVPDAGELIGFRFSSGGLRLGSDPLEPHLTLSRRELTSVIFGSHPERPVPVPAVLADLFPFYFPIRMLDHS